MKKKTLLVLAVLFILLIAACSNNSKVNNLASITQLFEDAKLHLKPQAEDSYPTIMSVKPSVYELLDDSIYIYVFESEDERIEASKELNIEKLFNATSYVYHINNLLMIYLSLSPPAENFKKQIDDIIVTAQ